MNRRVIIAVAVAIVLIAAIGTVFLSRGIPEKASTISADRQDESFRVELAPEEGDIQAGPIHNWLVTVTDPVRNPVAGASVTFDGGMPAHGHGLPTVPETTNEIRAGVYRVEGVKFSMNGEWQLKITVEAGGRTETATFKLIVE